MADNKNLAESLDAAARARLHEIRVVLSMDRPWGETEQNLEKILSASDPDVLSARDRRMAAEAAELLMEWEIADFETSQRAFDRGLHLLQSLARGVTLAEYGHPNTHGGDGMTLAGFKSQNHPQYYDREMDGLTVMSILGKSLARLSAWIDGSYPADMDPELHLRRRIDKLMEEVGETGQAVGGFTGENPRKGVTHTRDDVMAELLDVAVTALGAWEHMDGNRGRSGDALVVKLDGLLNRVNLGAEPGHMSRAYALTDRAS